MEKVTLIKRGYDPIIIAQSVALDELKYYTLLPFGIRVNLTLLHRGL
jgi:hypothetical protein